MSGSLTHSPADVIRQVIIDLSLGTAPSAAGSWPVFVGSLPNTPDSAIAVLDTGGRSNGRIHTNGETQWQHGIQITVRAQDHPTAYTKSNAIADSLDLNVANDQATISSSSYIIHSITRTTDVIALGFESPTSKRNLFTINAVAALRETT